MKNESLTNMGSDTLKRHNFALLPGASTNPEPPLRKILTMRPIQMVDLVAQYAEIETELNAAFKEILQTAAYINGPAVRQLEAGLVQYTGAKHVIACANGTDALQLAFMALGLKPGDEVLLPDFTYVATAEAAALLGLVPVFVDSEAGTFNLNVTKLEAALTARTKVVVPVHLFGQSTDMAPLLAFAAKHNLYVVEDNAQAIGAEYTFPDGGRARTGTMGHIGTTSFYPSKNLGAYGDAGALFTNDDTLAAELRKAANHGQVNRYYFERIGINSRLDSLQAAVLNTKLKRLDSYIAARQAAAARYDSLLAGLPVALPARATYSTHVFHQYTIQVTEGQRDALQEHLNGLKIPNAVFYPLPLHQQQAYVQYARTATTTNTTANTLAARVLSLPMHSHLDEEQQVYIADAFRSFFK